MLLKFTELVGFRQYMLLRFDSDPRLFKTLTLPPISCLFSGRAVIPNITVLPNEVFTRWPISTERAPHQLAAGVSARAPRSQFQPDAHHLLAPKTTTPAQEPSNTPRGHQPFQKACPRPMSPKTQVQTYNAIPPSSLFYTESKRTA